MKKHIVIYDTNNNKLFKVSENAIEIKIKKGDYYEIYNGEGRQYYTKYCKCN